MQRRNVALHTLIGHLGPQMMEVDMKGESVSFGSPLQQAHGILERQLAPMSTELDSAEKAKVKAIVSAIFPYATSETLERATSAYFAILEAENAEQRAKASSWMRFSQPSPTAIALLSSQDDYTGRTRL
jgi:hypothetical protein